MKSNGATSAPAPPASSGALTVLACPPGTELGALCLPLPAEWVDLLAAIVAERLSCDVVQTSPWLDRKAAAAYLSVSLSRLEKDRTVPSHRWEGRVLYHRLELDEWLLAMGSR